MIASMALMGYGIFTALKFALNTSQIKATTPKYNDFLAATWFSTNMIWIIGCSLLLIGLITFLIVRMKNRKKHPELNQGKDILKQIKFNKDRKNIPIESVQNATNPSGTKYVFISYHSGERSIADQLIKEVLEANKISYWIAPDFIPAGSSYAAEIEQAIKHCSAFIIVLSTKAMHSKWVEKELDRALVYNRIIIPFQIESCELTEAFQFYLSNVQRINAFSRLQNRFEMLVTQLRNIIDIQANE